MNVQPHSTDEPPFRARAIRAAIAAWLLVPLSFFVVSTAAWVLGKRVPVLVVAFTVTLLVAVAMGIRAYQHGRRSDPPSAARFVGLLGACMAAGTWAFTALFAALLWASGGAWSGGAWGRPLRVRGRQVHPHLRIGADWTRGAQPDASRLDEATRLALEALWLHDAQKEHASVPAFSRISWLLAAVGAPASLLEWSHRAALEEIEHARLCFALAAGYGGRAHTVEPMPDLLLGMLDPNGESDPIVLLARESLADGCQLEDYNADVARACADACTEPVTRAVLECIAREERAHADFSWALLAWLFASHENRVRPVLQEGLQRLERYQRPTAVSFDKRALVSRADPAALRAHGRLPDEEWAHLWTMRLSQTRTRINGWLLQSTTANASTQSSARA